MPIRGFLRILCPLIGGKLILVIVAVLTIHCVPAGIAIGQESGIIEEIVLIQKADVVGLRFTKTDTIFGLLPRPIPGQFTLAELHEFERRIRNLSLFDQVTVAGHDQTLHIEVLEKITLAPILDLTSGKTLADTSVSAGMVEYNIGGTGTQLGG